MQKGDELWIVLSALAVDFTLLQLLPTMATTSNQ